MRLFQFTYHSDMGARYRGGFRLLICLGHAVSRDLDFWPPKAALMAACRNPIVQKDKQKKTPFSVRRERSQTYDKTVNVAGESLHLA